MSNRFIFYFPSCSLRPASETRIFRVVRMSMRNMGERSIQYIGPVIWSSLPLSVRHSSVAVVLLDVLGCRLTCSDKLRPMRAEHGSILLYGIPLRSLPLNKS